MRKSGMRLLFVLLFCSVMFAEAGLYYCLTSAKNNLMKEQKESIESLLQTVDHNLNKEFIRNRVEIDNLINYEAFNEMEEDALKSKDYEELQDFFYTYVLSENSYLTGITAYRDSQCLFSSMGDAKKQTVMTRLAGAAVFQVLGNGDEYYIAMETIADSGTQYYIFFDMRSFIEEMFGEKVLSNNWLVAYNEESGLTFQNHYNQEQVLLMNFDEMIARNDGYSVIALSVEENQIMDQIYKYTTLENRECVDNRIIVNNVEILENDYFTLAIAQDSSQLYGTINSISRWSIICIAIIAVSVFGILWIIFRVRIRQYKKDIETSARIKDSQMRLQLAMQQMQPHFFYNSLSAIREIVLENPERASDLIYDFTVHLRNCIRMMANNELVPLSKEMENIQAYVSIEEARFDEAFTMVYNIEEGDFLVPPLSVQPFVENAIRHGIFERDDAEGVIRVESRKIAGGYRISVADNGVGFDFDKTMKEIENGVRDSSGMKTSFERIEQAVHGIVKVHSEPGVGTEVSIFIPEFHE